MHVGQPFLVRACRQARVVGTASVTQGLHIRAILFDPSAQLVTVADGSVTGDKHLNVIRQAIGKHIAGNKNARLLDKQRRMASGMRLMFNNPDFRAVPGKMRGLGGQRGNLANKLVGVGLRSPKARAQCSSGLKHDAVSNLKRLLSFHEDVTIICGANDKVFPAAEIISTLQKNKINIPVRAIKGVPHSPLATRYGRKLLKAALSRQ
jgi:hypothetical protein